MRRALVVALAALALAGCAPTYFACKGTGSVTGSGAVAGGMLYGGGGNHNYTVSFNCGDGAEIDFNRPVAPTEGSAK